MKRKVGSLIKQLVRTLLLLSMIVILYSYAMFQGGFISWFLFYSVTTVVVLGFVTALFPLRFISVDRSIQKPYLENGDHATVKVTITKNVPIPLCYLGVYDAPPNSIRVESHPGSFFFMLFKKEQTYSYVIRGDRRGIHTFTEMELETGDMIGLIKRRRIVRVDNDIRVYPKRANLPIAFSSLRKAIKLQNEGNSSRRMTFNETLDFSHLREYAPGDRLSTIDWKVTARRGELATKEFDTEDPKGFTVLLDCRAETDEQFETAVEWAAGLVHHSFTEKDIMNFAAISSTPLALNKTYEQKQLRQVMNVLTSVERDDLDEKVQLHRSFSLLRTIVYVMPTVTEKTTAKLKQLAARGYKLIVLYGDDGNKVDRVLRQVDVHLLAMPITKKDKRRRRAS
ncbi:DUF58 domain-containing protein [Geomicrobium sediminis]|uniref:Uncharacterized protein (DUF58 family) n=1 Tax=Geomicrobium sediminis TaxID=1347788 RepID=A0ABS2P9M4_9BACL|nr:DUF58 domain-containing protein [Geomicrobium sediminis]MBM7632109.1 uncharacterized protein (DUF58 family) [Geomicrobium sediminis]